MCVCPQLHVEVETNLLSESTQRQSTRYKSIFCQLWRRIGSNGSYIARVMTKARTKKLVVAVAVVVVAIANCYCFLRPLATWEEHLRSIDCSPSCLNERKKEEKNLETKRSKVKYLADRNKVAKFAGQTNKPQSLLAISPGPFTAVIVAKTFVWPTAAAKR